MIEAHCTKSTAPSYDRQGRAEKAWVPKRIPWQVFRLARRRTSVRLSQKCGELSNIDLCYKNTIGRSVDIRRSAPLSGSFFVGIADLVNLK